MTFLDDVLYFLGYVTREKASDLITRSMGAVIKEASYRHDGEMRMLDKLLLELAEEEAKSHEDIDNIEWYKMAAICIGYDAFSKKNTIQYGSAGFKTKSMLALYAVTSAVNKVISDHATQMLFSIAVSQRKANRAVVENIVRRIGIAFSKNFDRIVDVMSDLEDDSTEKGSTEYMKL